MKRDNVNYLLVGSFVLLMSVVLLYGLYRITGHSAKGDVYYTHFPNVAGIKEGTIVTYEGFEVGNVSAMEPVVRDKRTWYRITLNLRKPVRIPADSLAMIATPGLLTAPLVELKEGKSGDAIAAGGEIASTTSANLMESVATLASDLGRIAETGVKPLLAQISRSVETLNTTLDKNVPPAMNDMRVTLARLNNTSGRVEALFSDDNQKHWGGLLRNADLTAANALKLSTELQGVRGEVDGLLKDSRELVAGSGKDIQASLRRLDATLYQLEAAGRNLNEFSRNIRDNPATLLQNRPPVDVAGAAQ